MTQNLERQSAGGEGKGKAVLKHGHSKRRRDSTGFRAGVSVLAGDNDTSAGLFALARSTGDVRASGRSGRMFSGFMDSRIIYL